MESEFLYQIKYENTVNIKSPWLFYIQAHIRYYLEKDILNGYFYLKLGAKNSVLTFWFFWIKGQF